MSRDKNQYQTCFTCDFCKNDFTIEYLCYDKDEDNKGICRACWKLKYE